MLKNKVLKLITLFFILTVSAIILVNFWLGRKGMSEYVGEKITYDVRLGKIPLGKSTFSYISKTEVDGKPLSIMIFDTRLAHFSDTEKIYSDTETFLPVRVERKIFNGLSREKITEEYDQENFTVKITKKTLLREKTSVIQKESSIHNAILLPHHVRRLPDLAVGQTFFANLPNHEFTMKLISVEDIEIPAGTFKTYRFESTPKQITIWISADEHRIPVKIQGIGTYGYTMLMKEYTP
ncbi:MAG: DUF3108 domain-containing protein [Candidatus Omnitrophica bacterium]|nr:DUF3108 domain-containing protein [Candidatus Omnitrophota bacterium]